MIDNKRLRSVQIASLHENEVLKSDDKLLTNIFYAEFYADKQNNLFLKIVLILTVFVLSKIS